MEDIGSQDSGVTCLSGDWLALGQDIVSEWSDMSIWGLLFGWLWVRILCLSGATCLLWVRILCPSGATCLSGDCSLVGSGSGYCV